MLIAVVSAFAAVFPCQSHRGFFAEILGDVLTSSKFAAHEYNEEVVPSLAVEYEQATTDASVLAVDVAHELAFRRGLGHSLFATPSSHVDLTAVTAYGRSAFSNSSGIAVVSTGVQSSALNSLVGDFFTGSSSSATSASNATPTSGSKSTYYGGESRYPAVSGHHGGHNGNGTLLVAFQGGDRTKPEYAVLRALVGGESSLKWSAGVSPFSQISAQSGALVTKPALKAFNIAYSDIGLFGFIVNAPNDSVKDIATKAVSALKDVASGAKEEDVKRAINQAKFAAAIQSEQRTFRHEMLGSLVSSMLLH